MSGRFTGRQNGVPTAVFSINSLFSAGISEKSISVSGRAAWRPNLRFRAGVTRQCLDAHEFARNGSVLPEWLGVPR
jgi:hypothetical protein